ncbi:hypothetical protein M5D96_013037 [Drosophila gunungcola]|uniref:Uncharacterized protein n=1 Tax=Drosophila gunungcola TaxID=103775 RepID=A0A9P9YC24_9MUSC|nr:hypothetical protein M5D96_013037 [Drosophila gunungcola]
MDYRSWRKVLLQWVSECQFIEANYITLEQTDIEAFFAVYVQRAQAEAVVQKALQAAQKVQRKKHRSPLQAFIREIYPEFCAHISGRGQLVESDYLYVYTLLLHYSCVKQPSVFFHSICKKLPELMQTCIAALLNRTVEPQLTREFLRQTIANVASVYRMGVQDSPCPPSSSSSPNLHVDVTPSSSSSPASPQPQSSTPRMHHHRDRQRDCLDLQMSVNEMSAPSTPKTELLDRRTQELRGFRSQLDMERYEKNLLEEQNLEKDALIKSLKKSLKSLEARMAKMTEAAQISDEDEVVPNCGPNEFDRLKRSLMKEISHKDEIIAETNDKLQDLHNEKSDMAEKLKQSAEQLMVCMDRVRELELRLEDLSLTLSKKDYTISSLERDKQELDLCLQEAREELHSRREVLNSSSDLLTCSLSPNVTPENLASSVIDKQLREKEHENIRLREELQKQNDSLHQLTESMASLLRKHEPDQDNSATLITSITDLESGPVNEVAKNSDLQEKCDKQASNLDKLLDKSQTLAECLESQRQQLAGAKAKIAELEQEAVQTNRNHASKLSSIQRECEVKLLVLQSDHKMVIQSHDELKKKLLTTEFNLANIRVQLAVKEQQADRLSSEILEVRVSKESLQCGIDKFDAQIKEIAKILEQEQRCVEYLRAKYAQCRNQLMSSNADMGLLSCQLGSPDWQSTLQRIDELCEMKEQHEALKLEHEQKVSEATELRIRLEQSEEQHEALKLEHEQQVSEATELRIRLEQSEEHHEALKLEHEQKVCEATELRIRLEQSEEQYKAHKVEHEQKVSEATELRIRLEQSEEQHEALKLEHEQQVSEATELRIRLEQSEEHHEALKLEHEQQVSEATELRNRLEQSEEHHEALKLEHEQKVREATELRIRLEQSEEHHEALKLEHEQQVSEATELRIRLEQSEEHHEALKLEHEQKVSEAMELRNRLEQSEKQHEQQHEAQHKNLLEQQRISQQEKEQLLEQQRKLEQEKEQLLEQQRKLEHEKEQLLEQQCKFQQETDSFLERITGLLNEGYPEIFSLLAEGNSNRFQEVESWLEVILEQQKKTNDSLDATVKNLLDDLAVVKQEHAAVISESRQRAFRASREEEKRNGFIASLELTADKLSTALHQKDAQIASSRQQVAQLQQNLEEERSNLEEATGQLVRAQEQLKCHRLDAIKMAAALKARLHKAHPGSSPLKGVNECSFEELRQHVHQFLSMYDEVDASRQSLELKYSRATSLADHLKESKLHLEQQVAQLQNQMYGSGQDSPMIKQLKDTIANLELVNQKLSSDHVELLNRQMDMETLKANLMSESQKVEEKLQKQLKAAEDEVSNLELKYQEQIDELKAEIVEQRCKNLENETAGEKEDVPQLSKEQDTLIDIEKVELKGKLEENEAKILKLKEEHEQVLKSAKKEYEQRYKDLETQLKESSQLALNAIAKELEEVRLQEQQHREIIASHVDVMEDLHQSQLKEKSLSQTIETYKQLLTDMCNELNGTKDARLEREKEVDNLKAHIKQMETEYQDKIEQLKQSKTPTKQQKFQGKLEENEAKILKLKEEHEQVLKSSKEEYQQRYKDLETQLKESSQLALTAIEKELEEVRLQEQQHREIIASHVDVMEDLHQSQLKEKSLSQTIETYKQLLTDMCNELNGTKDARLEREKEVDNLKAHIKQMETEYQDKIEQLKQSKTPTKQQKFQGKLEENEAKILKLKEEHEQVLKSSKKEYEQRYKDLETKLNESSQLALNAIAKELEEVRLQEQQHREIIASHVNVMEDLQQSQLKEKSLSQSIETYKHILTETCNELNWSNDARLEREKEVDNLKAHIKQMETEYKDKIEQLKLSKTPTKHQMFQGKLGANEAKFLESKEKHEQRYKDLETQLKESSQLALNAIAKELEEVRLQEQQHRETIASHVNVMEELHQSQLTEKSLRETIENYKQLLTETCNELNGSKDARLEREKEVDNLKAHIKQMETEYQDKIEQLKLSKTPTEQQKLIDNSAEELLSLRTQLQDGQEELSNANDFQVEQQMAEVETHRLQAKLQEEHKLTDQLKAQLEEKQKELRSAEVEMHSLQAKLEEEHKLTDQLKAQLDEKQKELRSAEVELHSLQAKLQEEVRLQEQQHRETIGSHVDVMEDLHQSQLKEKSLRQTIETHKQLLTETCNELNLSNDARLEREKEIDSLKAHIKQMETEYKDKIEQLKLSKTPTEQQKLIDNSAEELLSLRTQLQDGQEKLSNANDFQVEQQMAEVETHRLQAKLQEEHKLTDQLKAQLRRETEGAALCRTELDEQRNELRSARVQLQSDASRTEQMLNGQAEELARAKAALESQAAEVSAKLEAERKSAQREIYLVKERMTKAEREHKVQLATLEDDLSTLSERQTQTEADRAIAHERIIELENKRLIMEKDISMLNEQLAEFDKLSTRLNSEIAQQKKQLADRNAQVKSLEYRLHVEADMLTEAQERLAKVTARLAEVEQANQMSASQQAELQQRLEAEMADREQDRQELVEITNQLADVQQQLDGTRLVQEAQHLKFVERTRESAEPAEVTSFKRCLMKLEEHLAKSNQKLDEMRAANESQMTQHGPSDLGATYSKSDVAESDANKEDAVLRNNQLALDCQILQAKYRDAKDEIQRCEQKMKDQRLEMEGKLDKMKTKMRSLYTAEVTRMKEKQERDAASSAAELEALTAQNAKYEEHTRKLSNQIVRLNEKILEQQKQHAIISTKLRHLQMQPVSEPPKPSTATTITVSSTSSSSAANEDWQPFKRPSAPSSNLAMEDEEGEVFNNTYLTDLKLGRVPDMTAEELIYRNSLQPPHLKSTYAAQYDLGSQDEDLKVSVSCTPISGSRITERSIMTRDGTGGTPLQTRQAAMRAKDDRDGPHSLDDSMSALLSSSSTGTRKKTMGTHYKRPGPPTPSKNGGRLSFGSSEPPREILREFGDHNNTSKTPARFKFLTQRFSVGSSTLPRDELPHRKRSNLLAGIQRRKLRQAVGLFCTSTPRKSRSYYDQQRLIRASDADTSSADAAATGEEEEEQQKQQKQQEQQEAEMDEGNQEGTPHLSTAALLALTKGNTRRLTGPSSKLRNGRVSLCLHGNIFAKSSRPAVPGKRMQQHRRLRQERMGRFDQARHLDQIRLSVNLSSYAADSSESSPPDNNNYSLHNRNDEHAVPPSQFLMGQTVVLDKRREPPVSATFCVDADVDVDVDVDEVEVQHSETWQLLQQFESENLATSWASQGGQMEEPSEDGRFEQLCQETECSAPFQLQPLIYEPVGGGEVPPQNRLQLETASSSNITGGSCSTTANMTSTSSRQSCTVYSFGSVHMQPMPHINITYVQPTATQLPPGSPLNRSLWTRTRRRLRHLSSGQRMIVGLALLLIVALGCQLADLVVVALTTAFTVLGLVLLAI